MAHAIWSGAINFGLVTIPVKLFTAVRGRSRDISFNFLHKKDDGRIRYKTVCELEGKEVPRSEIVRGYEYQKGEWITFNDEELKELDAEATQSVDIVQFCDLEEINPMFFDVPYYLEPDKRGKHAYALLRDALKTANKVGIAKVVLRNREHLAALKPNGEALVLELMHWADELVEQSEFEFPAERSEVPAPEMKVAKMLIDTMTAEFKPEQFEDTYREQLLSMIEARASGKHVPKARAKAPAATNVVNLMDVLQRSIEQSKGGGKRASAAAKKSAGSKTRRKKSAA
ncbi:MAG: Ku protein [Candidatus Eremiobacteraeota bacterium]|nr:Ku protein [Candidatus Eremiobacteraeota bacterium]MBV8355102.1 Ku protein [Candidatus Eremiobacteraeota bacterium]